MKIIINQQILENYNNFNQGNEGLLAEGLIRSNQDFATKQQIQ